jgi:hypothetical protein
MLPHHNVTHGHARSGPGQGESAEYRAWIAMRQRCYDQKAPRFADYGGRGIVVCDAWRGSFERFLADVGRKPTPQHCLDRRDNDGHYEPGNVPEARARMSQAHLPKGSAPYAGSRSRSATGRA